MNGLETNQHLKHAL